MQFLMAIHDAAPGGEWVDAAEITSLPALMAGRKSGHDNSVSKVINVYKLVEKSTEATIKYRLSTRGMAACPVYIAKYFSG